MIGGLRSHLLLFCPILMGLGTVLEEKLAHPDLALSLINRAGRQKQVMDRGERPVTVIDRHQYIFDRIFFWGDSV